MEYKIQYSKIKNIYIQIKEGKVIVKAPKRVTREEIERILKNKEKWINKSLDKDRKKGQKENLYTKDEFIKIVGEGICKLNGCNNETTFIGSRYLDYCCNSHSQLDPIINEKKCKNHSNEFFEERNKKAKKTKLEKYGNEILSILNAS